MPDPSLSEQLREIVNDPRVVLVQSEVAVFRAAADRLDHLEAVAAAASALRVHMRSTGLRIITNATALRMLGSGLTDAEDLTLLEQAKNLADDLTAALAALDPKGDATP